MTTVLTQLPYVAHPHRPIVPTLCVGMLPVALLRPDLEDAGASGGVSTRERGDDDFLKPLPHPLPKRHLRRHLIHQRRFQKPI